MVELNVNFENLKIGKTYLMKKKDEELYYIAQVVKKDDGNKHHENKVIVNILMTKSPSTNILDWEENDTDTLEILDFRDFKVLSGFPINDTEYDTLFPTHKRSHAVINKKQNIDEISTKDTKIPSLNFLSRVALPTRYESLIKKFVLPKTKRGGKKTRKTRKTRKTHKRKSKKNT